MVKISVKAPAKINLSLDVLHKRKDGYHEVKMIMTTVDLSDRVDLFELNSNVIKIEVSEGYVPSDQRNLAYQAAALLKERYHVKKGVFIYISKHIPVAAGLAGGSSDAAATLRGLNQLWNLGLSIEQLAEIGAQIGSDVPFCIHGGTALATGRGEVIKKIASPPSCWVVLAKPPIGVSTADIYRKLNLNEVEHPDVGAMIKSLEFSDYKGICSNLSNVLEDVTFNLCPEVKRIKDQMIRFGADGVLMSGSGPTVFGLVQKESKTSRIYNALRGFCSDVYAVRVISDRYS